MLTSDAIAASLRDAVPFVRTLGLEYLELEPGRALLRLPDDAAHHNHVAGPHAGAMFTLAESASGAIVIGSFAHLLDRATPLAARAEIRYQKLAMGPVLAEATLGRDAAEVEAELLAGGKPEFGVHVVLRTEDGTQTGEMTIFWALKPHKR
ncbi:DUF4442 domain-containing protein [Longispora albida]|uniref:DUF4442 domain-containing protein n=1 Tax=Longispora albida TaxID=203523 RepID=UPI00036A96F9|nr:DUF4442 domain-containing protein [Longispora albida]